MPLAGVLALASLVLPAVVQAKPSPEGEPASVERTLNADPKAVFEALQGALSDWKMRRVSYEDRIVKTSWKYSERLREKFRSRVVAEFRKDGYVTHLTVTHERQRQMAEVRQTVTAGAAPWSEWNGNWELARDVIRSVEQALGLEEAAVDINNISGRAPAPRGIVVQREYVVPPGVAPRVNDLKARRKSLVAEVRAIDAKILAAVYDGRYEEIKDEVGRQKERKSKLEKQVTAIDAEILQLVLSDGEETPGS